MNVLLHIMHAEFSSTWNFFFLSLNEIFERAIYPIAVVEVNMAGKRALAFVWMEELAALRPTASPGCFHI